MWILQQEQVGIASEIININQLIRTIQRRVIPAITLQGKLLLWRRREF